MAEAHRPGPHRQPTPHGGGRAHGGQQHPLKLYFIVWGWLFVLSACSYMVDYIGLAGLPALVADPDLHDAQGRA